MSWRRVGCRVRGDLWIFTVHRKYVRLPEQQNSPSGLLLPAVQVRHSQPRSHKYTVYMQCYGMNFN
jgi:hypothetical protein